MLLYQEELTQEDMDLLTVMGVYPVLPPLYPQSVVRIKHGASISIKRKTAVFACFDPDLAIYELQMFGQEFCFCSLAGLTGRHIYTICEYLYLLNTEPT